jgi:dienelactone hydrolase
MMHGCAGLLNKDGTINARETAWLEILRNEGYAVLLADSFTKRGHGSICRIRNRPVSPSQDRPHDAYGALQWLQAQPFVQPDRIILMGWSNGAMSMLWAMRQDAPQRPADLKHDFRAAIGFYPGCIKLRRDVSDYRAARPILLQVGLADDWTKPKPCMALADEATARGGAKMTYDAYEGAYHAFDNPSSRTRTITTKHSAYSSGQRTVHIGTNTEARALAIARVKAYLREVFVR